jgi:large subunit ribosomal protein L21
MFMTQWMIAWEAVMYAIFETGGKQYRVAPGDMVQVEKLGGPIGHIVEFNQVLMVHGDDSIQIGQPYLQGARVIARVVRQGRGPKIRVFKKKRRKGYRKNIGHRQWFTALRIQDVQV